MSEFRSPIQMTFSHSRNASSSTLVILLVNVMLSTDGGLYALIRANCRCPICKWRRTCFQWFAFHFSLCCHNTLADIDSNATPAFLLCPGETVWILRQRIGSSGRSCRSWFLVLTVYRKLCSLTIPWFPHLFGRLFMFKLAMMHCLRLLSLSCFIMSAKTAASSESVSTAGGSVWLSV